MVKFGEHGWPKLNQHPLPLLFHRRGEEQGIPSFLSDPLPFPICPSYFPNIHMMPSPPHFPPPATPLQGFSTLLPLPYPSTFSSLPFLWPSQPLHLCIPCLHLPILSSSAHSPHLPFHFPLNSCTSTSSSTYYHVLFLHIFSHFIIGSCRCKLNHTLYYLHWVNNKNSE